MNGKRPSKDASTKMTDILELPDNDFKLAFIKMLQQPITNSFETNGKLQERNEKCNKELSRSFETEKCNN